MKGGFENPFPNYKKASGGLAGHFHWNANNLRNIEHNEVLKTLIFLLRQHAEKIIY